MSSTVILFCVKVPVLSEQITETDPNDSTAAKFLIIACSLAIFWVPIACTIVTIELKASGIAATANATANSNASSKGWPRHICNPKIKAQKIKIAVARRDENWSSETCNGVLRSLVSFIKVAILPISVSIPVAVTKTFARP